jgi:multidrug efflux pump subunit AcrB
VVRPQGGDGARVERRVRRLAAGGRQGGPDARRQAALRAESLDVPGGRIERGTRELTVRTAGRFRSVEEIGSVVLFGSGGNLVRLRAAARIVGGHREVRTRTLLDGKEAVSFLVQKQSGTNTVEICDQVDRTLDRLARAGQLPKDLAVTKVIDGSTFIRQNQRDVNEALVFGGGMAILVVFLFMLDWRSTFITATALPTSVIATFAAMDLFGFSLNQLTLLGLSLAIGLLIDDAVVVRENIQRHLELGKTPAEAARDGTSQIGLAVLATTFTIVAVFVPVAFMGGMVGQFFREFGLTVAAAVLVSLFVSFTVDPMLSSVMSRPRTAADRERDRHRRFAGAVLRGYDEVDRRYRGLLAWALAHRKTVVFGATSAFLVSLGLVGPMGKEFLGQADRGEFQVGVELSPGTSFAETERFTRDLERRMREAAPEIVTVFATVGQGGEVNQAQLRVYTTPPDRRKASQRAIVDRLRAALAVLPAAKLSIEDIPFIEGANEPPVMLLVRGPDAKVLEEVSRKVFGIVQSTPGAVDARLLSAPGKPEIGVTVDRDRAGDRGLTVAGVALGVRAALEGDTVAKMRAGDEDLDVRVRLRPEDRDDPDRVGELTVPARDGTLVHLREVATIDRTDGPSVIERQNRQRLVTVAAGLSGRSLGEITDDIARKLAAAGLPAGYEARFRGETERMQETFSNMLLALGVAVLFIYFALASQFESPIHPLTIMVSLPLAVVGALATLFLVGLPLGLPAMIGVVLLMGLVTKNAILLVDLTNELRRGGKGIVEALLEAGPTRLRPILMTTAAAILGMLPLALSTGSGAPSAGPWRSR